MGRLVLMRRESESVRVQISAEDLRRLAAAGDDIELELGVTKARGGKASLDFIGLPEFRIVREELLGEERRRGKGAA